MGNRQRGDYFERQTKAALMRHGWVVFRVAGSLGPADLVALRAGKRPLFIACKVTPRIDPGERRALIEAAEKAGARPLMAYRSKRGHVDLWTVHTTTGRGFHVDTLTGPKAKAEP